VYVKFIHSSAQGIIREISPKTYILFNVYSMVRGLGHGSGLLEKITTYADDNDITLHLTAQAYGSTRDSLSNRELEVFYRKFDFEVTDRCPTRMVRRPSQKTQAL